MKYFVFRMNYEEAYYPVLWREIMKEGRLRQGWGAKGMSLLQTKEAFIHGWKKAWSGDTATEAYMLGKWNMLQIILEMEAGDLIVVPKMSMDGGNQWNSFTIMERTAAPYSFDTILDDFGHIVPVKPLVSFSYGHNDKSRIVSAKFKAYQRPINRVYAAEFCDAVDSLLKEFHENPAACKKEDMSSAEALAHAVADGKKYIWSRSSNKSINGSRIIWRK